MKKSQTYETQRLILQPTTVEDAAFIVELLNTPKWLKYIGDRNIHTIEEANAYITEKITSQFQRLGYGNYTVIRKADGVKVGSCGLYDREGVDGIDIGFGFLPEYEKQGYAFEASKKIKDLAINDLNLNQISAITSKHNVSSQKLLNKLGLTFVKIIQLPDSDEDLLLYQLNEPLKNNSYN